MLEGCGFSADWEHRQETCRAGICSMPARPRRCAGQPSGSLFTTAMNAGQWSGKSVSGGRFLFFS